MARHWKGALLIGGVGLLLMLIMGGLQSCTAMFGSAGTGVAATSYLSGAVSYTHLEDEPFDLYDIELSEEDFSAE